MIAAPGADPTLMWRCTECDATGVYEFGRPRHDHSKGPFDLVTPLELYEAPAIP